MIESAITRRHEGGLLVKLGNHRLTVPVATIMLGVLTAMVPAPTTAKG
jgi:hypothetical protein